MADAGTLPKNSRSPATYADIEALPEDVVGEILIGALRTSPRLVARHGVAAIEPGYDRVAAAPLESLTFSLDALWHSEDDQEPQS